MYKEYPLITITPITDSEEYSVMLQESGRINLVNLNIPLDLYLGTNVQAMIQYLVKNLLNTKNTNLYYLESGTDIMSMIGSVVTQQMIKDLTVEVTNFLAYMYSVISNIQDVYGTDDPEDLITGITLGDLSFDSTTGTVYITINIGTPLGSFPISLAI